MPASSSPYTELSGRRAFVTGGANGIGRAIAHALAQSGVKVVIADIDADGAQRAAKEIGTGAVAVAIDTHERASVERAFDEELKLLGGCDICIANAGVSTMQRAHDLTDAEWDFNFAVNARGIFLANQIAARAFRRPGLGLHRQHRITRRQGRRAAARPLFCLEIRRARLDAGARAGTCSELAFA
jgi:meso-butanediol dehydrogenase / (S,S)-butanediol dehydrogenase / diacetyl reductase